MSVVSAELRIRTLEGWISRGLWLFDTRWHTENQHRFVESVELRPFGSVLRIGDQYPLRWAFLLQKVSMARCENLDDGIAFDSPAMNSCFSPSQRLEGEGLRFKMGCLASLQEVEGPRKVEICANEAEIAISENDMCRARDPIDNWNLMELKPTVQQRLEDYVHTWFEYPILI
jgi:hypothetical protein